MNNNKMLLSITILIVALVVVLFYKFPGKKSLSKEVLEAFPDYYRYVNPNPMLCSIVTRESLINMAHIKKINDRFKISCEFGSFHEGLDYQNEGNLDVFFGLIKKCDENAARLIDEAVRSKGNCVFPLDYPIPDNLNDYYVGYFACNKFDNTLPLGRHPCYQEITNLGTTVFYSGTIAAIDINNKLFYP